MMKLKIILSCLLVVLLSSVACSVHAAVYYVKNSGNNSNTGLSDAQAWETVSKVNSSVSGTGDDVYFKCGDTWTGTQLWIDWEGTSGNRAVIGAYYVSGSEVHGVSGNKPIINGNDTVPAAEYAGLIHSDENDYVTIENLRVINSKWDGIRCQGASTSSRSVSNNVINSETAGADYVGIKYHFISGGLVESCDVTDAARLETWPAVLVATTSDNITIRECIVHENYGEGIGLYTNTDDCIVEDNICYANKKIEIYIDHSRGNIIRRNLVYGTTDTAFHRDAWGPAPGIGIADENWMAAYSENNQIYDNLIAYCSYGIFLWTGFYDWPLTDTLVYNNTIVDCKYGLDFSSSRVSYPGSAIKNNIFWKISGDSMLVADAPATMTFDYNLFSSEPADNDAKGTHDPTYAAPLLTKTSGWRSMTGGDLTGNDFTLQDSSPAINAGVDLGSPYNLGLNPTSTWPSSVSTLDQDSYGLWEIGGFVYTGTILPVVTTQAVTDITTTTAIGHGTITDVGGESNCTKRGICWNTTGFPTVADDKVEEVGSFPAGAFSGNMTGLTPDQTYFARAYAYNTGGYGYGSTEGFNTDADANGTYIIDDGDAETSFTGTWSVSGGANPYGSGSLYCHAVNSTYTYEKTLDGNYTVSLWWTEYASRSSSVTVKIYDSGDNLLDTKSVNQTTLGGQWNEQDTYDFNATAKVVILSTGGGPPNVSTCADAVKFDYVEGSGGEDVNNPSCLYGINLQGCGIN